MLVVNIPEIELFDDATDTFVSLKPCSLQLEHSLISISKWESKWCKPFIKYDGASDKTSEEIKDYIKCMTLTQNVDPRVYDYLPASVVQQISDYIEAPMTATWFGPSNERDIDREIITSEVIYYWMIALQVPVEFQKWHLNRLLTLIRVIKAKTQTGKKMENKDVIKKYADLNEQRRRKAHSNG